MGFEPEAALLVAKAHAVSIILPIVHLGSDLISPCVYCLAPPSPTLPQ